MSKTAPVENEHSRVQSQATSAAISSTVTKRPRGILDSMYLVKRSLTWSKMRVRAAAGVTQLTEMS